MKAILSAALALGLVIPTLTPAVAQDVGVRVGPGGAGIEVGRDRDFDRDRRRGAEFRDYDRGRGSPRVVIERRGRPDCRMVEVRTHRRGETIIRRERRCD